MTPLLPVEEARQRILAECRPVEDTEIVPLEQAAGRLLANDIVARRSQPPFAASAMDGYAVRANDINSTPVELTVVGDAPAGHQFRGVVGSGQAVRIFTGAPVPEGADTIVIQEDTERLSPERVRVDQSAAPGTYVRPAGLDFAEGEPVLKAGDLLDAGRLTVAAAMNEPALTVRRLPRVAILATGDELVLPGHEPKPDQIIASNSFGVRAIAEASGAAVTDLGIAEDRQDVIEAAIGRALSASSDVLITLGGASVGEHDLVQAALTNRGMTLDFWRIAMRPGKPLMYGRLDNLHVLGLPGNPVSSLVCSHLFLRPLLAALSGSPPIDPIHPAILGTAVPANDRRQDYLRARLERKIDGTLIAHPFDRQDSSMTRVFAQSDCLIIRKPFAEPARAGETCDIFLLRDSM
ncbi:MAG: molybdopterin molybdotransferase MoeA [Alphaproteobacteria bacterium]|nr:molybdopterin molybdotransferase MoeA [Alphaproteobacteria bacterium]